MRQRQSERKRKGSVEEERREKMSGVDEDEERRRQRRLEEALEVKSLRRIISAYLKYMISPPPSGSTHSYNFNPQLSDFLFFFSGCFMVIFVYANDSDIYINYNDFILFYIITYNEVVCYLGFDYWHFICVWKLR